MCIGVALFDDDIYIYILGPELSFTFGHDGWAGDVKKDVNPQTARPTLPAAVKRRGGRITDYDYVMLCYSCYSGPVSPHEFRRSGPISRWRYLRLRPPLCCVFVAPLFLDTPRTLHAVGSLHVAASTTRRDGFVLSSAILILPGRRSQWPEVGPFTFDSACPATRALSHTRRNGQMSE